MTNPIDTEALRKEFADYLADTEPGIKARAPGLNQIETLAIIAMSLFQAIREIAVEKSEKAEALEAANSRVATLKAQLAAVNLQEPVYQTRWEHPHNIWGDVSKEVFDCFTDHRYFARRIVYIAPQPASAPKRGRLSHQEKINESREIVAARLQRLERPLNGRCAAARDGDCSHSQCPQLRDGEPVKSGRHCPLDVQEDES